MNKPFLLKVPFFYSLFTHPFNKHYLFYFLTIIFLSSCVKDSGTSTDYNQGRYQYPNYINGHVTISHSWYKVCNDPSFNHSSKIFLAGDTVYASISEVLGPNWEAPEIGLNASAEILSSNGDKEKFVFDYPSPNCIIHIDGVLLWFSGIKTDSAQTIFTNNDVLEINNDTTVIVIHYKSYWTGNIVTDTAYIYP